MIAVARARQAPPGRLGAIAMTPGTIDVQAVRRHFTFPGHGRIPTNNAASTQPPRELLALYQSLAPGYENVHRGQSTASQRMTALFEESYDTIAQLVAAVRLVRSGLRFSASAVEGCRTTRGWDDDDGAAGYGTGN